MVDTLPLHEAAKKAFKKKFDGIIEIRPDGGELFYIDGRQEPPSILQSLPTDPALPSENSSKTQDDDNGIQVGRAVWSASGETLEEIFARTNALEGSYLSGRLVIGGDMSVMSRLKLEAQSA